MVFRTTIGDIPRKLPFFPCAHTTRKSLTRLGKPIECFQVSNDCKMRPTLQSSSSRQLFKTCAILSITQSICSLPMMRGGARRIIWSRLSLTKTPSFSSFSHKGRTLPQVFLISNAANSPFPLSSLILPVFMLPSRFIRYSPICFAFSTSFSSVSTLNAASAAAQERKIVGFYRIGYKCSVFYWSACVLKDAKKNSVGVKEQRMVPADLNHSWKRRKDLNEHLYRLAEIISS